MSTKKMHNWSRRIHWQPTQYAQPTTEQAIQALVIQAAESKRSVRIIGSAHSFMPLWTTDDVQINLDAYSGIVQIDTERQQATVKAGTKLYTLGEQLFKHGLAMENLGDIDRQSIGGTIGTGTHGTGLQFGSISTQIVGLRFVNGNGELVSCSPTNQPELFKAMQVSLGALGIITEITLQCVPAYKLALQNAKEPVQQVLDELPQRYQENRNFEFYWFPYTDTAWTKTSNVVQDVPDEVTWKNYLVEYVLENYGFQVFCSLARWVPSLTETVAKISAGSIASVRKVYHSHKVYATQRLVRFNEMEYSVPLAAQADVLRAIQRLFAKKKFRVHFPIEHRAVKADDIYLSPAYGRDSGYVACHVYAGKTLTPFFRELEALFRDFDGRPHWGKMHFWTAKDVEVNYPEFATFQRLLQAHDPAGIFLNDHLRKLLVTSA